MSERNDSSEHVTLLAFVPRRFHTNLDLGRQRKGSRVLPIRGSRREVYVQDLRDNRRFKHLRLQN